DEAPRLWSALVGWEGDLQVLFDSHKGDNFPARMAALIKRKKQALAEKLAKERQDRPMTQGQQRTYMRQYVKNQSPVLEEPSSKRQKSTEAPISFMPEVPPSPVVSSPYSSGIRRKSLGRNRLTKPKSKLKELDLDANDQTFIKVFSDEDSEDEAPRLWSALVGWETLSNVHVLETVSGEVVYMFADVSYPFSVDHLERMLRHKLEIDKVFVGNDMTTAKQLIRLIKN
nr:aminoacyl-tRNA synthetase, class 1a, anticodon-binding [Tanacetum cinerariifolium]